MLNIDLRDSEIRGVIFNHRGSRRRRSRALLGPLFVSMLVGFLANSGNAGETHDQLRGNTGWNAVGGVRSGGQYSALGQITPANIDRLERAWVAHTGDVVEGPAAEGGSSFQATPVFWNDTLFVCTPLNRVLALDAEDGRVRWTFDAYATLPEDTPRFAANCRGVALWVDEESPDNVTRCRARIIKPDIFARLYAIDALTGELCRDFGDDGVIDLNKLDNRGEGQLFLTSPPAIIGDLLVTGSGVEDNVVTDAADGIVRAFDVRTGELVWAFNPIPKSLSDKTGGANVWSFMAVDSELGMVYLPTTSPSVDPYGVFRSEPIPYADALVALDASTGEVVWSFQTIHHNLFDYDLPAQPILVDLKIDGAVIPAVAQVTKTGFVFVLDRRTGEPVHPIEEVPAPPSSVPGESAAPTQPVPVLPKPFARQQMTEEDLWGIGYFDKRSCRKRFRQLRYEGIFTPPSVEGSVQMPSALGGSNWGGAAIDPATGVLIVKTQDLATILLLVPADINEERPAGLPHDFLKKPLNRTPYRLDGEFFLSPLGIPCTAPPWGEIVAIDLASGEHLWRRPLGRVQFGFLRTPESWGSPNVGGPIVTGGGLIFIGAGMDSAFRALDLETGEVLWEDDDLPAPAMAVPMTYQIRGQQYVVVAAGGNALAETRQSDAIVAYRLRPER
jgi:quinoprotein glucose dehydrogenase